MEKSFHFDCRSEKTSYIALNNVENCDILVIQMAAEAAYLKYHTYRRERWKEKIMEGTNDRGALTLKFPVQSYRKIPNPYLKEEEGDKPQGAEADHQRGKKNQKFAAGSGGI